MKRISLGAICMALLSGPVGGHELLQHTHVTPNSNVIVVSCYRGPWEQVLWDRAKPEFFDSLTSAGYSAERARALADRVCRDQSLVGDPEAMRRETVRLISITPRS